MTHDRPPDRSQGSTAHACRVGDAPGAGTLDRREFLRRVAAAGAVLLLTDLSAADIAQGEPAHGGDMPAAAGISTDAYLHARQRAKDLVSQMTLAEMIGQSGNTAPAIKRLGLPRYQYWASALHGLVCNAPVTSFPIPLALGCTWDPDLAFQMYTAVSDEARAYHNKFGRDLCFWDPPTLNIQRDPRWGRCEEVPGEDPCLLGTLAVQMIRGMQGTDARYLKTAACAKHFICNNTDDDRMSVSASVDPRSFWEYYTRAFRAAVIQGDVFTVMGAYNAINGVPCCADHFLLTDLLRQRWGFRGYVTSDCDAIYNIFSPHHYASSPTVAAAMAIRAGCDLNCGVTTQKHLQAAVEKHLVSKQQIADAVTHILTVRFLLGEFDPPTRVPYSDIGFDVVNSPQHQALAVKAARETIVLLKNDAAALPLKKNNLQKVAVIGPLAMGCHLGGYSGSPSIRISPLQGIATALNGQLSLSPRLEWPGQVVKASEGVRTNFSSGSGATFVGQIRQGSWIECRPQDLTGKTSVAFRIANDSRNTAVIHVHADSLTGPILASVKVPPTGSWLAWKTVTASLKAVSSRHAIFLRFTGKARWLCNVQWAEFRPVEKMVQPQPQPGRPLILFHHGCSIMGSKEPDEFAAAVEAARQADVAILVCGINQSVDREACDRKDLRLPGVQHELIQACRQANPKTILVLSTNNTVAVNWEQAHVPAIVAAFFGGQAQGTAIADVLFGHYNPGGKTCCTWYKSAKDLPPFHDYDITKGRTYMYFEGQPLYPFGYGLSYTSFKFSNLKISAKSLRPGKAVRISARITNTGEREGTEVAQLYITAPPSPVKRPVKQLVDFKRLELNAGESKTVTFTLPYNDQALWYWHQAQKKFVLQPGPLKLMVGSSSADIHLTGEIALAAAVGDVGGPATLIGVAEKAAVI